MIRERCSCGAELETDEPNATRLLNAWRRNHPHQTSIEPRDIETSSNTETAPNNHTPELHIGFRNDPWEDKK